MCSLRILLLVICGAVTIVFFKTRKGTLSVWLVKPKGQAQRRYRLGHLVIMNTNSRSLHSYLSVATLISMAMYKWLLNIIIIIILMQAL